MKKVLFLILACLPFVGFAQQAYIINAPIGLLRDEPKVTAAIIHKFEENEKVKLIEKIDKTWSKVEYKRGKTRLVGYVTNHTIAEFSSAKDKSVAANATKQSIEPIPKK
jgi:uncharacterized protein YgiM (DUF1202 family)